MCIFAAAAGCENDNRSPLREKVKSLTKEKSVLSYELKTVEAEKAELQQQVQVLSGLEPAVKVTSLYNLVGLKIGRFTNVYDRDKDGSEETLLVYIQPIDEQGDIIKAAGTVDVELWDISRESSEAKLGVWHITTDELKKLWLKTLLSVSYRLEFDVSGMVGEFAEPLTVKVTFTDYLAGKVFKEQFIIEPKK